MTSAPETGPADQHLGESLAALIDGELSHDSRDRVLAHLATCPSCKAEADAQRRLKSVFAQSPLPAVSDGLLARLQGLPASDGAGPAQGSDEEPPGPDLGPLPGGRGRASLLGPPVIGGERGFRIHEPGAALRLHRGHRLAFAAAGAVSLAAFAIGGAMSSPGTAGAGAGAGTSGSTLSTVAAGGGTPAGTARPTSARGGESETEESTDSRVSLPITLVSYTGEYFDDPDPTSGSADLAEELFPELGSVLAPDPAPDTATSASTPMLDGLAPARGSGGVGAMNAR